MKRIIFRADAGRDIGYGHFVRTLALADMLKDDFKCIFATVTPTVFQIGEIEKVCELIILPDKNLHFDYFLTLLRGDEIVVLDNYFFTEVYQRQIKKTGCSLVCIDDLHDKHFYADIVINHALGMEVHNYSGEPYTNYLLGFKYALLRKEYMVKSVLKTEKKYACFIMIGAADPYHLTSKIVRLLEPLGCTLPIAVVVGDGFADDTFLKNKSNISVFQSISGSKVYELMQESEFGILPASTSSIEACAARLPFICGYYVDNQKELYKGLQSNQLAQCVGNYAEMEASTLTFALQKMMQPVFIEAMKNRQSKILDKKSKMRFIKAFKQL
jgi:UDP-2,4-diacetamido-2,4,6-trideoxy-beta-L-altropyranose hydrolase